jgi:tRNA(Arg) A34 adenosine deaminase TadA
MVNKWMDESLDLATEALEAEEVPVGCVFLYNDEAIAKGHSTVNETHSTTKHCMDQTVVEMYICPSGRPLFPFNQFLISCQH